MAIKKGYKQLVAEAEASIKTYSTSDAHSLLKREGVVMVDIRDVREIEKLGQLPGAIHAPRGMLEFWVDPESPYHRKVFAEDKAFVLYCGSGWRSALAVKAMQDMGLDNFAHIGGGFSAWQAAGYPVDAFESSTKSEKKV